MDIAVDFNADLDAFIDAYKQAWDKKDKGKVRHRDCIYPPAKPPLKLCK